MLKKPAFLVASALATVTALLAFPAAAVVEQPKPWQIGFQPAATPVMQNIESFHLYVVYIITVITLFVLGLLVWVIIRYNRRANPTPSPVTHNTVLEIAWTIIPVVILIFIAIPSFKLLYYEADVPNADVTIRAIGHQWYWSYEYPGSGNFSFDSMGLSDADADKAGEPHLLGVTNPVVVPVGKNVVVQTVGADVIHSWAVPSFGLKMDAIPGRINVTWFKALREGTFYGECSELCGAKHAFMPIEVKVVSQPDYEKWLAATKKKYASNGTMNVAALTPAH